MERLEQAVDIAVAVIFQFEPTLIGISQSSELKDALVSIVHESMSNPADAEKTAKASVLKILNTALMNLTQQIVDEKISGGNFSTDDIIEINVTARLVSFAVIQLTYNVISGIIKRNIESIIAKSKAGLLKDREAEIRREHFNIWLEKRQERLAEEERQKVMEDEKRWAEWDSLTEAERAARTFEMAEALTMGSQPKAASGKTAEEIEKERIQKEEEERRLESEALEEAAHVASAKLIGELEINVLEDLQAYIVGTFNTWAINNDSGRLVAEEAGDLAAQCLQAYSAEGDTAQTLQVFDGLVLGKLTKDAVDNIKEWLSMKAS